MRQLFFVQDFAEQEKVQWDCVLERADSLSLVSVSLGCGSGSDVIYACGKFVLDLVCVNEALEC
jgi:hypothetical protein